jgi:hypothetical protein
MFPDQRETDARARALRRIPWPIPAAVLVEFSDEDLDALADAAPEEYLAVLNRIVGRIMGGDDG